MKKYLNIDVNSTKYSKLTKEEKLRVVKEKLNALFNDKSRKVVTVRYNGGSKTVPYDMLGVYKDLCDREKSLEKRVKIDFDYDNINKPNEETAMVLKGSYVSPTHSIKTFDALDIDQKIKYIKTKMFAMFDLAMKYEQEHKTIVKVSYGKEQKFIPYSLYGDYKRLKKVLNDLERQKRESLENIAEANKVIFSDELNLNDDLIRGDGGEDLSSVWNKAFEKRSKTERHDEHIVVNASSIVEQLKKQNTSSSSNMVETEMALVPPLRPLVLSNYVDNSFDRNKVYDKINDTKKKKTKTSLFTSLLGISFVKKISEKIRKNREMSPVEKQIRRKQIKTTCVALALAAVAMITGVLGGIAKKKSDKNNNVKEETSVVCQPHEKGIHTEEERQMLVDYYNDKSNLQANDNADSKKSISSPLEINNSQTSDYKFAINGISFGDTVKVNDNAYIYTNCYDAASTTNGLTPYFDGSMAREVTGVVYNLDGQIIYLYSNDIHSRENEKKLLNQGAIKVAYLVGNYEGYYNANDVYEVNTNMSIGKDNAPKTRIRIK